ncbi:MAG: hypothetical protein KDK39_08615 [Leptospiraceae bacterium]|nr:hypothetical protein [Leptospiraceae bacterium]
MKRILQELPVWFSKGFSVGLGFTFAISITSLLAVTISGTINLFSSGDVVSASKINENFASLKTAIESINPAYNTSEVVTDQVWIDGKPIYRKVVNTGALPNNTTNNIAHGITGMSNVIRIYGFAKTAASQYIPMPYPTSSGGGSLTLDADTTNINIFTNSAGFIGYTTSYVVLEYTK